MSQKKLNPHIMMPSCHGGEDKKTPDGVVMKTDSWKKTQKLLEEASDRICIQTVKHDGSQYTIDICDGKTRIASHNPAKLTPDGFLNTSPNEVIRANCAKQFHNGFIDEPYPDKIHGYVESMYKKLECKRLIVRGEMFGKRIPIAVPYKHEIEYNVFEIIIDGKNQHYDEMKKLCEESKLTVVPEINRGTLKELWVSDPQPFSIDGIPMEGTVIADYISDDHVRRFKQREESRRWRSSNLKGEWKPKIKQSNLKFSVEDFKAYLTPGRKENMISHGFDPNYKWTNSGRDMRFVGRFVNLIVEDDIEQDLMDRYKDENEVKKIVKAIRKQASRYTGAIKEFLNSS